MKHEKWAIIHKGPHKTHSVSNQGRCRTTDNATGRITYLGRGRRNQYTGYLVYAGEYVHRLVAQAFVAKPSNPDAVVVSHKNTVKEDNRATNLAWTTTAANNRNTLTRTKRAISHKNARHDGQIIKAVRKANPAEVVYFRNGCEAARVLGCSHVLIYNSLGHKQSARYAKGWELNWININEAK